MSSLPQLRADINALQKQLAEARARIAELESMPEVVREVLVPFETVRVEYIDRAPIEVVKYVDNPDHLATIAALQSIIRGRE